MTGDFQVGRGIRVPSLEGIAEGYHTRLFGEENVCFEANVSAERIVAVVSALGAAVREPGFLILERTAPLATQQELGREGGGVFIECHYLHHVPWPVCQQIIEDHAEFFTHDGDICFGYGSYAGVDQVMVGGYKSFYVVTDTPAKYPPVFASCGIPHVHTLRGVRAHFTAAQPGYRLPLRDIVPGMDELFASLQQMGLELAKHRRE